jgi:hypothetical protein
MTAFAPSLFLSLSLASDTLTLFVSKASFLQLTLLFCWIFHFFFAQVYPRAVRSSLGFSPSFKKIYPIGIKRNPMDVSGEKNERKRTIGTTADLNVKAHIYTIRSRKTTIDLSIQALL